MTEKRYIVKGTDDFFQHIEDTTFTEDKHEGSIYNIYQVVDRLNEQEETIQTQKDYLVHMGHGTIFEEMKWLKERNQRQYERLKEVWDLIFDRNWEELEKKAIEMEENEKLLQTEYGDVE